MANVVKEKRGATKAKLTASATRLFYNRGLASTSIADVSEDSGVPLGNIYYHFKTKDALAEAVLESRIQELKTTLKTAQCQSQPLDRLKALLRFDDQNQLNLVSHGCPYMSLIQDLLQLNSDLSTDATELLELHIDYAESQFEALGFKESRDLALGFIGRLQGAYLMGRGMNSKAILMSQVDQLELWLDGLST